MLWNVFLPSQSVSSISANSLVWTSFVPFWLVLVSSAAMLQNESAINHLESIALQVEVARAKKQLQSMLMMNLESRVIVFEDIGR